MKSIYNDKFRYHYHARSSPYFPREYTRVLGWVGLFDAPRTRHRCSFHQNGIDVYRSTGDKQCYAYDIVQVIVSCTLKYVHHHIMYGLRNTCTVSFLLRTLTLTRALHTSWSDLPAHGASTKPHVPDVALKCTGTSVVRVVSYSSLVCYLVSYHTRRLRLGSGSSLSFHGA